MIPLADRCPLTKRQAEVLAFIKNYVRTRFESPTYEEISKNFGFSSSNSAFCHVKAIEKKGWLIVKRTSGERGHVGQIWRGITPYDAA